MVNHRLVEESHGLFYDTMPTFGRRYLGEPWKVSGQAILSQPR